jgi:hypothetical protein
LIPESPQYFALAKEDVPTIRLAPLPLPVPLGFSRKDELPSSFALLSISFREDPKGKQIADWLASYPPNIVSGVNIEGLILKARLLQGLGDDKEVFTGSILKSLSTSTQGEILNHMINLSKTMSTSAALAKAVSSGGPGEEESENEVTGAIRLQTLKEIDRGVCVVAESIEEGILLDSNTDLSVAQDDHVVEVCGANTAISLRQRLVSSAVVSEQLELPRRSIVWNRAFKRGSRHIQSRFRVGEIGGHPIIAETFSYEASTYDTESEGLSSTQLQQLKKMAAQLCHPKSENFHILPGLGFIHEKSTRSFSLLFELDTALRHGQCKNSVCFTTLSDYMSKQRRVPLGDRIQLAFTLAKAIENFHKVGWVHKSFKSSNVILLSQDQRTEDVAKLTVNLHHPWVFGFGYSRPEDGETDLKTDYSPENNAYMHPERWRKPLAKFSKAHDVYSLVSNSSALCKLFFSD